MSGSGMVAGATPETCNRVAEGMRIERANTLAFLARRRARAATMIEKPDFAEQGRWLTRQLQILEDDLRAELHVGDPVEGG